MMKLSPPWETYFQEIKALFDGDPDIMVRMDAEESGDRTIKVFVNNAVKADALEQIMPKEKAFGNVKVFIQIIPANTEERKIDLFRRAFAGNSGVSFIRSVVTPYQDTVDYVVFAKEVVQFFNDDLSDIYGNKSMLYEDIARDVFEDAGVYFCTDEEDM